MWKKWIEVAVIVIGTLGWWGFVYPELTITEDTYIQESADQEEKEGLCIKSRLLEYILGKDEVEGVFLPSGRKKGKPKG